MSIFRLPFSVKIFLPWNHIRLEHSLANTSNDQNFFMINYHIQWLKNKRTTNILICLIFTIASQGMGCFSYFP